MRYIILFALITLSNISFCAEAKVYKWIDGDGKVHYTEHPPTDTESTLIETAKTPKTAATEAKTISPDATAPQAKAPDEEIIVETEDPKEVEKIRLENCEKAKKALASFTTYPRVRVKEKDKDSYRYLSEEERQTEIKKYQDYEKQYCNPESSTAKPAP